MLRVSSPSLTEAVLLAGRVEQSQALRQTLSSANGIHRYKGDSLDEVLAFIAAQFDPPTIGEREYLRARTLIVQSENAARYVESEA